MVYKISNCFLNSLCQSLLWFYQNKCLYISMNIEIKITFILISSFSYLFLDHVYKIAQTELFSSFTTPDCLIFRFSFFCSKDPNSTSGFLAGTNSTLCKTSEMRISSKIEFLDYCAFLSTLTLSLFGSLRAVSPWTTAFHSSCVLKISLHKLLNFFTLFSLF